MGVLIDWPGEAPAPRRFVFLERETAPPLCCQDLLQSEQDARALEEINALYVALTRAEHRLVVSSFVPHRRPERASWWERLQGLGEPEPVGELSASIPATSASSDCAAKEVFTLSRLPALAPLPKTFTSIAPPVDNAPPATAEGDLRTRLGLAMHRLLQWHPTTQPFEWTELHVDAVAREFELETEEALQAHGMAARVVNGEGAWAWDAHQLVSWGNEVDMVWEGAVLRLDRLVQSKQSGEWWVIDFKSHENPEQRPAFLEQIRRYGQAMSQAQPGATVRLAFINALGHWREVPFL
jgi:ATP-dependent helicase/nuclease subunit A